MSDKNENIREINKLLAEIDSSLPVEKLGKQARLTDAKATLEDARRNLAGLRRTLIQHRKPDGVISQDGTKLGDAIRDYIKQITRLEAYVMELEALPDDEPEEPTAAKDGSLAAAAEQ